MLHYGTMDFMVYGFPCCLGALGCRDATKPQIGLRPLRGACTAGRGGRERQAAGGPHLPKSGKCGDSYIPKKMLIDGDHFSVIW